MPWFLPALVLVTFAGCSEQAPSAGSKVLAPDGVVKFLENHWRQPLASQGARPSHFEPPEAELDPASCGTCHVQQFQDWGGTRHAKAMGPGVLGQLMNMEALARDEHQACIRCHAPLAEQANSLITAISTLPARKGGGLHEQGLVCAACHVRGHQRFGPARRDGSAPKAGDKLPHGGWVANSAFADSRFCAACHQFGVDDFALNGKLLENTYAEWKASRYSTEGKHCQSCHMPDRRHLWRGIHDPDMVRSGITVRTVMPLYEADTVRAKLTLRNTGTGHHFPTYVTPKVVIEIFQEDKSRRVIASTRREHVIARTVALDLSREIADTRLAAGAEAALDYAVKRDSSAASLVYRIRVEPDAFYTELYRSLIADGAGKGEAMIRQALADSLAARFTLFEERKPLGAPPA